jgi:hypothetical protein
LHLAGKPMLLVELSSVAPTALSWDALVCADTLRPQWFEDALVGMVLGGRIISGKYNDIFVLRPDRAIERTFWSQEWLPASHWVRDGRMEMVTAPNAEAPRFVSLDPLRGEVEERTVSATEAARLSLESAPEVSRDYTLGAQGVRVVVSDGRAVALLDGEARWDRTAQEWFTAHDRLYEIAMDEWPDGVLRRLDPPSGEVVAELSGATLRAEGCYQGGTGCREARTAAPPDLSEMSPETSAPTRRPGPTALPHSARP